MQKEARMRPAFLVGILLLAMSGMAVLGQGDAKQSSSYESVIKDMLAALNGLTDVLGTIKDEPSALAARPEVKKAAGRLAEVRKQAEKLKQPDKAEKDRIARAYKDKLDKSLKRLLAEQVRVKAIPGGQDALKEINGRAEPKK
jgi:hypothetical protein